MELFSGSQGLLVTDICSSLDIPRSILHSSVHCTMYTVHCTLYTLHCTLYTVHCTRTLPLLWMILISRVIPAQHCLSFCPADHQTLYRLHCTVHSVYCIQCVYSVQCTVWSVYCRLQGTVHSCGSRAVPTIKELSDQSGVNWPARWST